MGESFTTVSVGEECPGVRSTAVCAQARRPPFGTPGAGGIRRLQSLCVHYVYHQRSPRSRRRSSPSSQIYAPVCVRTSFDCKWAHYFPDLARGCLPAIGGITTPFHRHSCSICRNHPSLLGTIKADHGAGCTGAGGLVYPSTDRWRSGCFCTTVVLASCI